MSDGVKPILGHGMHPGDWVVGPLQPEYTALDFWRDLVTLTESSPHILTRTSIVELIDVLANSLANPPVFHGRVGHGTTDTKDPRA